MERFVLEFGGATPNPVDGAVNAPDVVRNLRVERMGGYQLFGNVQDAGINVDGTLVGTPSVDLAGFLDTNVPEKFFMLLQGNTLTISSVVPNTTARISLPDLSGTTIFIPNSGLVSYSNAFVLSAKNARTEVQVGRLEHTYDNTTTGITGGNLNAVEHRVWVITYFPTRMGSIALDGEVFVGNLANGAVEITLDAGVTGDMYCEVYLSENNDTNDRGDAVLAGIMRPGDVTKFGYYGTGQLLSWGAFIPPWSGPFEVHLNRGWGQFSGDSGTEGYYFMSRPGGDPFLLGEIGAGEFTPNTPGRNLADSFQQVNGPLTLNWSRSGVLNIVDELNYVILPAALSTKITGLASTPAGLLIYCEREMFLARGDPSDLTGFSIQRVSMTVGMDDGTHPAKMAGVAAHIFQGEIYVAAFGMGDVDFGTGLQRLSDPVYLPADPFTHVGPDPVRNSFVAVTQSGKLYRYYVDEKIWVNDFDVGPGTLIFPSEDGSRYYPADTGDLQEAVVGTLPTDEANTPALVWGAVDCGDKGLLKLLRRLEINTNPEYVGNPTLTYSARGAQGTVVGENQGGGRWVFTFPRGVTATKADLTVTLHAFKATDVLEQPAVLEFVPRYRER